MQQQNGICRGFGAMTGASARRMKTRTHTSKWDNAGKAVFDRWRHVDWPRKRRFDIVSSHRVGEEHRVGKEPVAISSERSFAVPSRFGTA